MDLMYIYQIFFLYSLVSLFLGYQSSIIKKNSFGLALWFLPLGAFVWGDALIFGIFWLLATVLFIQVNSIWFTVFFISCFWFIRALGEMVYWLNQQFSPIKRDPAEQHFLYPLVKNESVWFLHQIIWQCVAVFSLVSGVYAGYQWLVL